MLADKKVNAEKKTEIKNIMPLVSIKLMYVACPLSILLKREGFGLKIF